MARQDQRANLTIKQSPSGSVGSAKMAQVLVAANKFFVVILKILHSSSGRYVKIVEFSSFRAIRQMLAGKCRFHD